jgi:hypothetical protein
MPAIGGLASFPDLAVHLLLGRGVPRDEAEAVVNLVPEAVRSVPCFLDRLSMNWLYDFGEPVTTTRGFVYGGGKTWHEITILLDVLLCAKARLDGQVLDGYLRRLADPKKHADVVFEFAPILHLDPTTKIEHEVPGQGNKRIDWRITDAAGFNLLLEVKIREADLIRSFERIEAGERAPNGHAPEPDHDTDLLFRSVEGKFLPRSPDAVLQGAWIGSALKQASGDLDASFRRLDPTRVHFAILGDWDGDVHLMARDGVPRERLIQVLGVREGERLVYQKAHP